MPTTLVTTTSQSQESHKDVASYQKASMEDSGSRTSSDAASHASFDHASETGKGVPKTDNDDDASGSSDTTTRHPETPQPGWKTDTNLPESDTVPVAKTTGNDHRNGTWVKQRKNGTRTFFGTWTPHIDLRSPTSLETGDNQGFIPASPCPEACARQT